MSSISKIVNPSAISAIQKAAKSVYAHPSKYSPNAPKLVDGAIQRVSVQPSTTRLAVKVNTDKVGITKRPEPNSLASSTGLMLGDLKQDYARFENKIARIYMPQKKHVHNHP